MFNVPTRIFILLFGALLAGCVTATDSQVAVSPNDIPVAKYKRVAVFVENMTGTERAPAEQTIVSTLQSSGVNAVSGNGLLNSRGNLSDSQKIRKLKEQSIDALLYVKVQMSSQQLVGNARTDGQLVYLTNDDGTEDAVGPAGYILNADGSVHRISNTLVTRSELQDLKSAKLVWTADTVTSPQYQIAVMGIPIGNGTTSTSLFTEAAREIVSKMRSAHAI
jgi:hypothetical protein